MQRKCHLSESSPIAAQIWHYLLSIRDSSLQISAFGRMHVAVEGHDLVSKSFRNGLTSLTVWENHDPTQEMHDLSAVHR